VNCIWKIPINIGLKFNRNVSVERLRRSDMTFKQSNEKSEVGSFSRKPTYIRIQESTNGIICIAYFLITCLP
jgi:hypothetical protein